MKKFRKPTARYKPPALRSGKNAVPFCNASTKPPLFKSVPSGPEGRERLVQNEKIAYPPYLSLSISSSQKTGREGCKESVRAGPAECKYHSAPLRVFRKLLAYASGWCTFQREILTRSVSEELSKHPR